MLFMKSSQNILKIKTQLMNKYIKVSKKQYFKTLKKFYKMKFSFYKNAIFLHIKSLVYHSQFWKLSFKCYILSVITKVCIFLVIQRIQIKNYKMKIMKTKITMKSLKMIK